MNATFIAKLILDGFKLHYDKFQAITANAPEIFLQQDWHKVQSMTSERIKQYDDHVDSTIKTLKATLTCTKLNTQLWHDVKQHYFQLLTFHPQAELAETYYNSVFCRLFHHRYFNNTFIFVKSSLLNSPTLAVEAEYRSYFPVVNGLIPTIKNIISHVKLQSHFRNLDKDICLLIHAFQAQVPSLNQQSYMMRFDMLKSPFYRNKAAYIVGRVISRNGTQPFVIAVLHHPKGGLYLDALITNSSQMRIIFGFARAYFFVQTHAPSALVQFLNQLMPSKTPAELYSAIGFHKQGKTEFYREFLHQLSTTKEQFTIAPGTLGMVMMVFTLPNFPYVFKVIKDKFSESKPFGRDTVLKRYQLVKQHDRVGRMADTLEYSNVAIPLSAISTDLLEQLKQTISSSIHIDCDMLIIKHLYIERRMTPLNLYLENADEIQTKHVICDYGYALKEMLHANIFPGDMLLKNFGVTNHKRVIFYDYDEVQYLTDMTFKALKKPSLEDLYSGTDEQSIAPQDVFPEQLYTFVLTNPKLKTIFKNAHPELLSVAYWQQAQRDIANKAVKHIYPYPQQQRFINFEQKKLKERREHK